MSLSIPTKRPEGSDLMSFLEMSLEEKERKSLVKNT